MDRREVAEGAARAPRASGGRHAGIALGASLLGAIVTFLYFRYVEVGTGGPRPGPGEIAFSIAAFGLLAAVGYRLSRQWLRVLDGGGPGAPPSEVARRRALLLPYGIALVTLIGWGLAGIVWGVVWPLMAGTF